MSNFVVVRRNNEEETMMETKKKVFTLELFGLIAIILALLIFLWDLTFIRKLSEYNLEDAVKLLGDLTTACFFIVGGLSLSYFLSGLQVNVFTVKNFVNSVVSTLVTVMVLFYVNTLVPIRFEIPLIDNQMLGVLIGVAEECFFRLFLCGMFWRITNQSTLIAVIGSSAIWTGYHIARYGGNFNILFVIFLCGCVLGLTFIYTRNGDGPVFGHAVVNYIVLS